MNKKMLAAVMAAAVAFGACKAVWADEKNPAATRNSLHSDGRIVYQEGENSVVLDSQDLYMIADRLDLFKMAVSKQLASMGTYLTKGDGIAIQSDETLKVTHMNPAQEHSVDPLTVDFNALLEGVAASQSIPAQPEAYGYDTGTTLYRTKEGALSTTGEEAGCEALLIQPATEENLSAGTAAWVNGHLLLGNGGDNEIYYEQGRGQTSEMIVSIISLLYSGVNETRAYAVSGKDGGSLSVSIKSKETEGPYSIGIKSELIPVWNLEGEGKRLLTKLQFNVDADSAGARRDDDNATQGNTFISYTVYDQNGRAIGSGSGEAIKPIVIEAMTLPITTQYIYVEATGSVSVYKEGHGSGHGTAHITFQSMQATYLIN